jgi:hypothetical protein
VPAEALKFLDPKTIRLFRIDGSIELRAEIEGHLCILSAKIKKAFPLSSPSTFLSLQDAAGKEIGLIEDTAALEPESRKVAERDLDRRYFTPKISSIDSLKNEGGMWTFEVTTQRGPAQFYVRNWRDSAFEIQPGRWLIHSVDGQRFEVVDSSKLDTRSQVLLEQVF